MYELPIDMICSEMRFKMEGEVLKAVRNVGINVNKEELEKALAFDRGQYEKGYRDAMKDAVPLEPLCEWLAKNACYDQLEDYGMRSRFSLLAEQWKFALTKWMEGLDAAD